MPGSTQPPTQFIFGGTFFGVHRQPGREADHSFPSNAESNFFFHSFFCLFGVQRQPGREADHSFPSNAESNFFTPSFVFLEYTGSQGVKLTIHFHLMQRVIFLLLLLSFWSTQTARA